MGVTTLRVPCFLVEWYRPDLIADRFEVGRVTLDEVMASWSADRTPVRLLLTLTVPDDQVVFGVVTADSADIVAQVCQRAGVPAERITAAVDTGPDGRLGRPGPARRQ